MLREQNPSCVSAFTSHKNKLDRQGPTLVSALQRCPSYVGVGCIVYKSVVKIHLNLREPHEYGTMTKSYRQNLKAGSPCLTFTCQDSFPTAAGLGQSVERLTEERELPGSIPGSGPTLRVLK